MNIVIERPSPWATQENLKGSEFSYTPLFFKESWAGVATHTGIRIVVKNSKEEILDVGIIKLSGTTGRLVLNHEAREPVDPPIDK